MAEFHPAAGGVQEVAQRPWWRRMFGKMDPSVGEGSRELDRLIFFSDAVFAIVMILLVLAIRVPEVPSGAAAAEVTHLALELWPKFFSYVLSFLVISTYWIAHHQTFGYIESHNRTLLWLNLLFLLSITFIPFPTDLLGKYGQLRFSVIVYAASVGLARLLLAVVWWYAGRESIRLSDDLDQEMAMYNFWRSLAIPALFLLSIGILFLSVNAAIASWLLMFAVDAVMFRLVEASGCRATSGHRRVSGAWATQSPVVAEDV